MGIQLELEVSEVNAILGVLGEMPSKSGAWPLIVKIKAQAEEQLPPESEEDPEDEAAA
jgi:hypothetical protein